MKNALLITTAIALCLVTGAVHAQVDSGNNMNSNAPASPGNFNTTPQAGDNTTVPNMHTNTDTTATGMPHNMDARQFGTYTTTRWDMNGDGVINRAEWTAARPHWFGSNNQRARTFAAWDTNRNGSLDAREIQSIFSNSDLYSRYDRNGDGVIDGVEAGKIPQ